MKNSSSPSVQMFSVVVLSCLAVACSKEASKPANQPPSEPAATAPPAPKPAQPTPAPAPAAAPEQKPAEPAVVPTPAAAPSNPALLNPAKLAEKAPAKYKAKFVTSKGDFVVEVQRAWAPNGADRFYNLVKNGYFDDTRFFRAIKGFMVQWGIHGDPAVNTVWREARIEDDPVKQSNKRGMVTFATAGPNTRTTQLFISYADSNARLDEMGFAPFGKVITGMDVVDALHTGYGEGAPNGMGPRQDRVQGEGNAYLTREFPQLDYVKQAKIVR